MSTSKRRGRPALEERGGEGGLDRRERAILRSVIREHIQSGEPIGSRTVSRGPRLDLSPASVRSIMADLESRGFLTQPHASAGRLPTPKAYRMYVDRLMDRQRVSPQQTAAIERALFEARGEVAEVLGEACRQLSRFSNQVGLVLAPALQRVVVEHVEFVRLDEERVVAILVGRSGVVHNRILRVEEPFEQAELDHVGRYLSEEFRGHALNEIREILRQRMSEERAVYDRLMARGLDLGRRTLEAETEEADLIVDGASNLVGAPEFTDPERMKAMMLALERKRALIDLLGRVLDERGVQVVIGEESQSPDLAHCSLVASTYGVDGQVLGTLGIVGPTRMAYAQAIALVDHLAAVLSRLFSGPEN